MKKILAALFAVVGLAALASPAWAQTPTITQVFIQPASGDGVFDTAALA